MTVAKVTKKRKLLSKTINTNSISNDYDTNKKDNNTNRKDRELLIVAGSYERLLYGLTLNSPSFIYPSHISTITCLRSNSKYLITGSVDEQIKIYSLGMRKEVGVLACHQGTITALIMVDRYVISSAEDGLICLTRMSDWETIKTLKGHKGPVLGIDAHPSGKILMSVGKDQTLKTWDLTRGLLSFSLTLINPLSIKFTPCGSYYCIGYDKQIEIYSLDGNLVSTITSPCRINKFVISSSDKGNIIIYGGEDKVIRINDINGTLLVTKPTRHELRIKDMSILNSKLVTCSSEGLIILWDINDLLDGINKEEYSYEAKCRLTCIDVVMAVKPKITKLEVVNAFSGGESEYEEEKGGKVVVTME